MTETSKSLSFLAIAMALFSTTFSAQATLLVDPPPIAKFEDFVVTPHAIPEEVVTRTLTLASGDFTFSTSGLHGVENVAGIGASNGTNYLFFQANTTGNSETFSRTSGGLFDLTHIDIGGWYNFSSLAPVLTITGIKFDSSTVTATVSLSANTFTTFTTATLVNFTGLQSVSLGNVSGISYVALDNINYVPAIAPVPEPETYALMLGGLALVGWATRRRVIKA